MKLVGLMEVFVSFFEVGDPTVWGVWGFWVCECMKTSFTETARQIFIIRVSSNLNKVEFHVFFYIFPSLSRRMWTKDIGKSALCIRLSNLSHFFLSSESFFTNNSPHLLKLKLSSDAQTQLCPGSCCVSVARCFSWNVRWLFDCSVSCDFRGPLSRHGNSLIRELRHSSPSLGRAPLMSPSM